MLTVRCSVCNAELREGEVFELQSPGNLACEGCVRKYYQDCILLDVNVELQIRRKRALEWLKHDNLGHAKRMAKNAGK